MLNSRTEGDLPSRVVEDLCSALRDDSASLAERALLFRDQLPTYAAGAVSTDELLAAGARSIRLIADRLSGVASSKELDSLAWTLGRQRAEAGIPAGELHRALNYDFETVWMAAGFYTSGLTPAEVHLLGARLWGAADQYSRVVLDSYVQRQDELRHDDTLRMHALMSRLQADTPLTEAELRPLMESLGFSFVEPVHIIVAEPAQRGKISEQLTSRRSVVREFVDADYCLIICQLKNQDDAALDAIPGLLDRSVDCARVRAAARAAVAIHRTGQRPSQHLEIRAGWRLLALTSFDAHREYFLRSTLRGILDLSPHTRGALLQTLRSYFSNGSIVATAAVTYAHRNTVKQRMELVQDLTSLDPRVPADLSLLMMAVDEIDRSTRQAGQ